METNNQYILVNLYDMINSYYTFRGCREKKLTYTDRKTVQVTEIFCGFHRESAAATRRTGKIGKEEEESKMMTGGRNYRRLSIDSQKVSGSVCTS